MMIDIQIPSERINPLVVSADTGVIEYPDSYPINIGYKVFKDKPGHFSYEWLVEWMTVDEVAELIDALQFVLDHRIEVAICDECTECQKEEV